MSAYHRLSRVFARRSSTALLAVTQLLACGSDGASSQGGSGSSGSGPGGGAPSGGSSSNAGSPASAGNSGAAGGSGGGVAGGSTAGAGGAASVVVPPDDFDPAIPKPSFDCRTSELDSSKRCVSIRGTLNGVAVDTHCSSGALVYVTFDDPLAWVADCLEGPSSEMGRRYQVTVPVQKPGTFSYDLPPGPGAPYAGASMTVAVNLVGGSSLGDHYAGGALSGVAYDGDFGTEVILGSFHGSWKAPTSASCDPGPMGMCAPGEINGTFRIVHAVRAQ